MLSDFVPFDRADIDSSIPQIFERQVRAGPKRVAVSDGQQQLTYDELNRWANRIAQAILHTLGESEEPVALLFHQGRDAVAATLGTLKAGKIYVPLDPGQSEQDLRRVIADCKPRLIVTDAEHEALARPLVGAQGLCQTIETMSREMAEDSPGLRLAPERVSYIFYTSGTTGPPKGVFDSHRNVLHNIMRYTNTLAIRASDRVSLTASCSFSGTVSSLFSALLNGATICPYSLTSRGIENAARWVDEQRITIFHSMPMVFEQLLAKGARFDDLRIIRLEGDRAEPRHLALFQKRFRRGVVLVNGLGTTETGIVRQFFVSPDDDVNGPVVPIGRAVEDMDVTLIDDKGHEVEVGAIGEIVVQSDYLACGYWGRPDLTDARFLPDPTGGGRRRYRTGDLGRLRADGLLDYLGRKDFQAKLRGQWIDAAEIESALTGIESISRALVMTRDDGMGTQQLVAYLVADGDPPSVDTLRQVLSRSLPAIMVPARFVFMERFPEDRNGKVNRRALPEPGRERPHLAQIFVAPRDAHEKTVADCFCQVLQLDRVGIDDDFLDLGGDSLLATEFLLTLEKRLGVTCSPALISESFSVASIIDRLQQSLPESALVPMQAGDGRAPLFCIHGFRGQILEYYHLLHCLGPDQPVYGVQSRAYMTAGILDRSIEAMAAAYVQEITALQGRGPYHLCGNCFGGTVAYEMACQLSRQGHEVGLLALIDTEFPAGRLANLMRKAIHPWRWRQFLESPLRDRAGFLAKGSTHFARALARMAGNALTGETGRSRGNRSAHAAADGHRVWQQNLAAMLDYRPQAYGGAMALFCIAPLHNQRGWMRMAAQGCQVIEVPHEGQLDAGRPPHLTSAPYVTSIAQEISALLAARSP